MKAPSIVMNASLLRLPANEGQAGETSLLTHKLQESINTHLSETIWTSAKAPMHWTHASAKNK